MPNRKRLKDTTLVFGAALAVRVWHAAALSKTPFFLGPIIDSQKYYELAENVATRGDWGGAFYQPPLYPAIWALLRCFNVKPGWSLSLTHALVGSATAVLFYFIGNQIGERVNVKPRWVGLSSGLCVATYGPLVLYDLEYLPPAWVHLLLASAWCVTLSSRSVGVVRDLISGLLIGLAATGWTLSLVFLLPTLILRLRDVKAHIARGVAAASIVAGTAAPIAVVHHHNATQGFPSVIISWNGGLNFWLGNNPNWRETWRARPGPAFEAEYERPEREGYATPDARDSFFYRTALKEIVAHPVAAARRTIEKLYYVWHGREMRRNQDFETLRTASPLLRLLMWEGGIRFPFGLVAPLALMGAWRLRRYPAAVACLAGSGIYSVLLATHIVAARYRLPMLIWLVPFAAMEAAYCFSKFRSWRVYVVLLAATVICNLPNDFTATFRASPMEQASLRFQSWGVQGEWKRQMDESDAMIRQWPDDLYSLGDRAQALQNRGQWSEALTYYSRFLDLAPAMVPAWVGKGVCYEQQGEVHGALSSFRQALALNPYNEAALREAALLYLLMGKQYEARWLTKHMEQLGYRNIPMIDDTPELTASPNTVADLGAGP